MKIGRSDIIGQRGMAHIDGVVHSMGYVFYPTGGVEAGIDGFIELRDEDTGTVGNLLLQVQGKAAEPSQLRDDCQATVALGIAEGLVAEGNMQDRNGLVAGEDRIERSDSLCSAIDPSHAFLPRWLRQLGDRGLALCPEGQSSLLASVSPPSWARNVRFLPLFLRLFS